jgi:hypothetical protein
MWDAGANDVEAVEANILWYSPWVDYHVARDGNQEYKSAVSAWVMLNAIDTPLNTDYLQDGWLEYPYGDRHDFIEWAGPSGKANHYDFGPWSGINSYVTYRTEYNPSDNKLRFYMSDWNNGNAAKLTLTTAQTGFIPNRAQVSGETHSSADQMAGGVSFPENFWWPEIATARQYNYHLSDTLGDFKDDWPGVYGKYPGDGQSNLYGINYFSIWDGACGH